MFKRMIEKALTPHLWLNAEEMLQWLDSTIERSSHALVRITAYQKELEREIRTSRKEDEDLFACYVSISVHIGDFKKKLDKLCESRQELLDAMVARGNAKKNLR